MKKKAKKKTTRRAAQVEAEPSTLNITMQTRFDQAGVEQLMAESAGLRTLVRAMGGEITELRERLAIAEARIGQTTKRSVCTDGVWTHDPGAQP